jgi:hypothetical protein
MHAAGAAGAAVVLADCSSTGNERGVAFYGASCVDNNCGEVVDAGGDGRVIADAAVWDTANPMVFYGAPCLDACGPPEDTGSPGQEASVDATEDASQDAPDAGAEDATGDVGDGG